jgi:hypothetical protein
VGGLVSSAGASGRLLLIAAVVAAVIAAVYFACLRPPPNEVALQWLTRDCTVGERVRVEAELRRQGAPAERTLLQAFARGPSAELLDEVAAEAGNEYDEVAQALSAGLTYGLNGSQVDSIRAISREEHVRGTREDFDRNYRAAALTGLGVLALPRGLSLLQRLAADTRSPNRATARLALEAARRSGQP